MDRGKKSSRGGRGGSNAKGKGKPEKKENILDLSKYSDKKIIVKYQGGRQVVGLLKGYDPLQNLVLDDTWEYVRDINDPTVLTDEMKFIGLVVCRGTTIILISPFDGTEPIEGNPYLMNDN